jgi:hypothetical protein
VHGAANVVGHGARGTHDANPGPMATRIALTLVLLAAYTQNAAAQARGPIVLDGRELSLERELAGLENQGGPVLWHAGMLVGVGAGLALAGGLSAGLLAGTRSLSGLSFGSGGRASSASDGTITIFSVLAAAGGALLITGILWLIERAGPYQRDAPRRDRMGEIQRELYEIRRARQLRAWLVPDLRVLDGGLLAGATGSF